MLEAAESLWNIVREVCDECRAICVYSSTWFFSACSKSESTQISDLCLVASLHSKLVKVRL